MCHAPFTLFAGRAAVYGAVAGLLCLGAMNANLDIQQRIAQWENMTEADPDNAMGWFSLGNAYKDAGRPDDAVKAFQSCIERDPTYSRAYQNLGQVLMQLGRRDEAAELLTRGYRTAAERGDVMPQKAMGSLLEKLGREVPDVSDLQPKVELSGDQMIDRRTGQVGTKMPDPPMRGPIGQFIQAHFTQETWREWIGMGTKVINELRLDFSIPEHQDIYEQHMLEYLGFTREEAEAYAAQQESSTSYPPAPGSPPKTPP